MAWPWVNTLRSVSNPKLSMTGMYALRAKEVFMELVDAPQVSLDAGKVMAKWDQSCTLDLKLINWFHES